MKEFKVIKKIVWMEDDEKENINRYDLSFQKAKETILNSMTLTIANIHGDFTYVGPNEELSEIYLVYAINDEGLTRIVMARRASDEESQQFFNKIKGLL
jgi:uncharacterized DUF497 family protein